MHSQQEEFAPPVRLPKPELFADMNIAIIGYGDASTASTRFRYNQYQSLFMQNGDRLNFIYKNQIRTPAFWKSLQSADMIINQKCLFANRYAKQIFALNKPTYFDFDDAIWTRPGKPYGPLTQYRVNQRLRTWLRKATGVLVANQFLAERASLHANHVHVIPMALDTSKWKPSSLDHDPGHVVIGWNGSPNNLPLLESIDKVLVNVLAQHKNVQLRVLCGKKPALSVPFDHHPFVPENEITFVQSLDIGLLPLLPDEYSHGKSPIKGLQYLACGVSVVGHINHGGTSFLTENTCLEVKADDHWQANLSNALRDSALRRRMGESGVDLIAKKHSLPAVFESLCEAISR